MLASMLARIRLWRIRHANGGDGSGMAAHASRISLRWVMMAVVFPLHSLPFESLAACWSIQQTVTHGERLAYSRLTAMQDGSLLDGVVTLTVGRATSSKATTGT